jgi:hypothetical protein
LATVSTFSCIVWVENGCAATESGGKTAAAKIAPINAWINIGQSPGGSRRHSSLVQPPSKRSDILEAHFQFAERPKAEFDHETMENNGTAAPA